MNVSYGTSFTAARLTLVLGLLAVKEAEALGLGELVDLGTGKGGKELLGEGVVGGLALTLLLLLVGAGSGKGGGTTGKAVSMGGQCCVRNP